MTTDPFALAERRGAQGMLIALQRCGLISIDHPNQAIRGHDAREALESFDRTVASEIPSWSNA